MLDFITDFVFFVSMIFDKLDEIVLYSTNSFSVSYLDCIIAFILLSLVVSIFWRGAQS